MEGGRKGGLWDLVGGSTEGVLSGILLANARRRVRVIGVRPGNYFQNHATRGTRPSASNMQKIVFSIKEKNYILHHHSLVAAPEDWQIFLFLQDLPSKTLIQMMKCHLKSFSCFLGDLKGLSREIEMG
jgi:hypothetical protein